MVIIMGDSTEKKAKGSYFKGLKAEFKKISWPDRKTVVKQTIVVVVVAVLLGLLISALDVIIQYGVNFLTSI